ncbi:MAG: hypothetical protein VW238_02425 [Nitrosomonadales bacterium]
MIFNNYDVLRELNLLPFWREKNHQSSESQNISKEEVTENLLLIYKFSHSKKQLNIIIEQNGMDKKSAKSLMESLALYLKNQFEKFELLKVLPNELTLVANETNIVLGDLKLTQYKDKLINHASLSEMADNYILKKKLWNDLKEFFNNES